MAHAAISPSEEASIWTDDSAVRDSFWLPDNIERFTPS